MPGQRTLLVVDDDPELLSLLESFFGRNGYVRDGRDEPPRQVTPAEWLADALEPYLDRGVSFRVTGKPARIRPLALKRALINLIENALGHGAPPVEVQWIGADDRMVLRVDDHGEGMRPSRIRDALKPFETFDTSRTGRHSGLGLATVDRIARQHGGSLHLANLPSRGFRAELRLNQTRDGSES